MGSLRVSPGICANKERTKGVVYILNLFLRFTIHLAGPCKVSFPLLGRCIDVTFLLPIREISIDTSASMGYRVQHMQEPYCIDLIFLSCSSDTEFDCL